MDELSLYEKILNLSKPWFVEGVSFDEQTETVTVHVAVDSEEKHRCSKCNAVSPGYDSRKRTWRHLDTCQYKTLVTAYVPRVECATHGCDTVDVPWAEERSRFTLLFESEVINRLQSASVLAICKQLRMSWNSVDGIMRRAVARGQSRMSRVMPTHICVDEVAIKKGHVYMTIISKPCGQVIAVEEDRKKESLKRFYDRLTDKQKTAIKVISMDMSAAYLSVTLEEIPDAREKIAFDRFHVAKLINEAVDGVRKQETRALHQTLKQARLTGKRYHWLKNSSSLSKQQRGELKSLQTIALKTGRAWMLKEYARELWNYSSKAWAKKAWMKWYGKAIRSQLKPMRMVARSVKKNLWGILNAIVLGANNGIAESINSKIKMLKVKCRGFRNSERFKVAILFHCGGLSLHP